MSRLTLFTTLCLPLLASSVGAQTAASADTSVSVSAELVALAAQQVGDVGSDVELLQVPIVEAADNIIQVRAQVALLPSIHYYNET